MVKKIVIYLLLNLFFSTILFSQILWDKFRVPIEIQTSIGIGYDNNFLRISDSEIENKTNHQLGLRQSLSR